MSFIDCNSLCLETNRTALPESLLSFLLLFRNNHVYQPLYLVTEKTHALLLGTVN